MKKLVIVIMLLVFVSGGLFAKSYNFRLGAAAESTKILDESFTLGGDSFESATVGGVAAFLYGPAYLSTTVLYEVGSGSFFEGRLTAGLTGKGLFGPFIGVGASGYYDSNDQFTLKGIYLDAVGEAGLSVQISDFVFSVYVVGKYPMAGMSNFEATDIKDIRIFLGGKIQYEL